MKVMSEELQSPRAVRILRPERLLRGDTGVNVLQPLDSASWIWAPGLPPESSPEGVFLRFRLRFEAPEDAAPLRLDVSADERFVLLLDGAEIARGPHYGTVAHWLYQSYEVRLAPGPHLLEAVVWRLGDLAPVAQFSWRGGFALAAEGEWNARVATGCAPWEVSRLRGTRPGGLDEDHVSANVGPTFEVRGTSFLREIPPDADFAPAAVVRGPVWSRTDMPNFWGGRAPGWQLYPSTLPDMMRERKTPGVFVDVRGLKSEVRSACRSADGSSAPAPSPASFVHTIPPHAAASFLWDLGEYYCAYPEMETDGGAGAVVRWGWAEALRGPDGLKLRDRNAPNGGEFSGFWDEFRPDGRVDAHFTTPWWRSGRWCRIQIETAGEPLVIRRIGIVERRYPAEPEGVFTCDDASLADVQRLCVRGLQMCMHETFFDCPHYEQLMYVGDTRVQMLAAAALSGDDRLVRRAADLFDESRRPDGITGMRFPSRHPQESATYAMIYPLILRDTMMLRDCETWLRARAPGMRHLLHGLATYAGPDGLLRNLPGWSFVDWAPEWNDRRGVPPGGRSGEGASAPANYFYILALKAAAEVETALGGKHLAAHWRRTARDAEAAAFFTFWNESRGLLADDEAHTAYSEHTQCLALLGDALRGARDTRRAFRGLLEAPDLARCTVYFSHYLFETFLRFGRADLFLRRLDLWRDYAARGLRTPQEAPDCGKNGQRETRSDCHAWGSHPLWHLHAGVAGVRPAAPFYRAVLVAPQPGPLRFIRSTTPTPRGPVALDLAFDGDAVHGIVTLPDGLSGTFSWRGRKIPLGPGKNDIGA